MLKLLKLLFHLIIVALLIFAKVKLGLHNHFYVGVAVAIVLQLILLLMKKGADYIGK